MDEIKYKIRRSLLLAVNDYPVTSLEYVLKHPFIQALSVDVEIIRIEWFKLIKYGYLKPIAGYDNTVRINEEQIDAIRKELDEFNANIAKKTPEQIQAFEEKLKYIRAVCLLNETGAIKRFVNMIRGNNRNYIHDLSSSIAHYGDIKDKLVTNQENWIDTIRVTIGRTPKNPINKSTTKKLDRTKTDPLMR